MRNLVITCMLMVMVLAAMPARACGPSLLYFYDEYYDQGGWGDCSAELVPGEPLIVHVLLESYDLPYAIREISFEVLNWIGSPGAPLGQVTEHWTADQVSGSLEDGITLVWEDGLEPSDEYNYGNRHYDLGTLEIEAFSPDWVGPQHKVTPLNLHYVDIAGWEYEGSDWGIPEMSTHFTFNGEQLCIDFIWDPAPSRRTTRHFLPADGSVVAPTFPLSFQVINLACEGGGGDRPFEGVVFLEDELIAQFSGEGVEDYAFTVDATEYPPLSAIQVLIRVTYFGNTVRDYALEYIISDEIPAEEASLSALKALYR